MKEIFKSIKELRIFKVSASISFYILTSLLPFFALLIHFAYIFSYDYLELVNSIKDLIPIEVYNFINYLIMNIDKNTNINYVILIALFIYSLSRIFGEFKEISGKLFGCKKENKFKIIFSTITIIIMILVTYFIITVLSILLNRFNLATQEIIKFILPSLIIFILYKSLICQKIPLGLFVTTSILVSIIIYLVSLVFNLYYTNISIISFLYGAMSFLLVSMYYIYTIIIIFILGLFYIKFLNEKV